MTTDTTTSRPARPVGAAALGVAVLSVSVVAAVVVVLGAVLDGGPGLLGALAGAGITLLVLSTGYVVVDLVASLMPAFSLLFALLTYTFQVVLLAAVLAVLRGADDIERTLAPTWFAGGVITVALVWTVCLVWHATQARIPLYDVVSETAARPSDPARAGVAEGSER